jgi:hypothetical protein
MKKVIFVLFAALLLSFSACAPLFAGADEQSEAAAIGGLLVKKCAPESADVTVSQGGKLAWIEMKGSRLGAVRVEEMKLLARLKARPQSSDLTGGRQLAGLIESSDAEITLLEKDVNSCFAAVPAQAGGLSDLVFDFRPGGFIAKGIYTTKIIFEIKLHLEAEGKLGLRPDGLYIEDPVVRTEGLRQPDSVAKEIAARLNPLLSFSSLPFPVSFKRVTMTDAAAVMTGDPKPLAGGESWSWRR